MIFHEELVTMSRRRRKRLRYDATIWDIFFGRGTAVAGVPCRRSIDQPRHYSEMVSQICLALYTRTRFSFLISNVQQGAH